MTKKLLAAALLLVALGGQALAERKPRVLFFTKSSGYEHPVIKNKGEPSLAEKTLRTLADQNGFELTHTKDGALLAPDRLAEWDVLVFYTTLDLTQPGKDKNPPMPPEGKPALLEAVRKGKGFIGIHAATDTFLSGDDPFADNGEAADPYIKMLGGEFIVHGEQQTARLIVHDRKFPGLAAWPAQLDLQEEWYSFKNLGKDLHVLMSVDTWSLKNSGPGNSAYRRPPYPVTWTRMHGKGRLFYTALGHREDVWNSTPFQEMLVGALKWTSGKVSAKVEPNVARVTPGYQTLPPNDKAPPKTP
jgi:uncharacterized protein